MVPILYGLEVKKKITNIYGKLFINYKPDYKGVRFLFLLIQVWPHSNSVITSSDAQDHMKFRESLGLDWLHARQVTLTPILSPGPSKINLNAPTKHSSLGLEYKAPLFFHSPLFSDPYLILFQK